MRLVTAVGSRLPAFAAASGRVDARRPPASEVAALYEGCELVTPTGRRLDGLERAARDPARDAAARLRREHRRDRARPALPGRSGRAARACGRRDHAVRTDRSDERRPQARDAPRPAARREGVIPVPSDGPMEPARLDPSTNQSSKFSKLRASIRRQRPTLVEHQQKGGSMIAATASWIGSAAGAPSSRTTTSTSSSPATLSRRDFLRRGSMIGMSAPLLGAILAACGSLVDRPSSSGEREHGGSAARRRAGRCGSPRSPRPRRSTR